MNYYHNIRTRTFKVMLIIACVFNVAKGYSQTPDTWTKKADFGGIARSEAIGFSINGKGYLGTGYNGSSKKDFWEYDPLSNNWKQLPDFGTLRDEAVAFSIGNKGYVGTGWTSGLKKDFWEYDPVSEIWTQKADFGGPARRRAVGFSINGKGYLGTGDGDGPKDFFEYDPELNTWTKKANVGGPARGSAVGFSIGNKGYIGTGYSNGDLKDFWEYDPVFDKWTKKKSFGGIARSGAIGFSIGNKGYIGTGFSNNGYEKDFWEYDPALNQWIQKSDFGGSTREDAVGFSIGNKGYIGTGFSNVYSKDFWEYTPGCTPLTVYADFDNDGYGDISNSYFSSDCVPVGYVTDSTDCNDANSSINPGATESANGIDDNCNGVIDDVICHVPTGLITKGITANSVKFKWDPLEEASSYKLQYKKVTSISWIILNPTVEKKTVNSLSANTQYVWQIKSVCGDGPKISSDWSAEQFFTTLPLKISIADKDHYRLFSIYPNPAKDQTTIQFALPVSSYVNVKVYDVNGREIECPDFPDGMFEAGNHFISINTAHFSKGIYFVKVISENGIQNEKLIVQ
ncbi:MAG TPA: T9SS type A sorting domain-containing protein [Chitinophagales bacterium]|nr:T9SS type A sorting domain-containing protein [Chitinophagales bacterium]